MTAFRVEVRDPDGSAAIVPHVSQSEAVALVDRLRAAFLEPIVTMTQAWLKGDPECPYA
jgi:hypothetical protein